MNRYIVCCIVFVCIFFTACKSYDKQKSELPDTPERGTIYVSADESFQPVIDQQVAVYESNNPGTKIIVSYKPEAECFKDLFTDSVRMIIVTRNASEQESEAVLDSLHKGPKGSTIARDGIAVIVHPSETDTLLTMNEIKQILTGKFRKNLIPVFDGLKATSTVRFVIDSVLKGDSLTPKAVAARSSKAVIDYVSNNTGVIGFIGVSWIGNPEDTSHLSYLKNVKVVSLEATDVPGGYCKANQANIYFKRYPMVRDLVYILKENYKGLGSGFADSMSGDIGQRIFRRSYLAATKINLGIRQVRLRE